MKLVLNANKEFDPPFSWLNISEAHNKETLITVLNLLLDTTATIKDIYKEIHKTKNGWTINQNSMYMDALNEIMHPEHAVKVIYSALDSEGVLWYDAMSLKKYLCDEILLNYKTENLNGSLVYGNVELTPTEAEDLFNRDLPPNTSELFSAVFTVKGVGVSSKELVNFVKFFNDFIRTLAPHKVDEYIKLKLGTLELSYYEALTLTYEVGNLSTY